jgi:hypothetical protein
MTSSLIPLLASFSKQPNSTTITTATANPSPLRSSLQKLSLSELHRPPTPSIRQLKDHLQSILDKKKSSQPESSPRSRVGAPQKSQIVLQEVKGNPECTCNPEKMLNFGFMLNYSNGILVKTPAGNSDGSSGNEPPHRYFAHINRYNNPNLIRQTVSRRPWWVIVDSLEDRRLNFAWTQLPVKALYERIPVLKRFCASGRGGDTGGQRVAKSGQGSAKDDRRASLERFLRPALANQILDCENLRGQEVSARLTQQSSSTLQDHPFLNGCRKLLKITPTNIVMQNKLESNFQYGHKSAMLLNLRHYCSVTGIDMLSLVPPTFYVTSLVSPELKLFENCFHDYEKVGKQNNLWLVKPAENTFGGQGIIIADNIEGVHSHLKEVYSSAETAKYPLKFVIQKYIENPLLYEGRKFDVRTYMLITSFNGRMKAYWHPEGYLRTSARPFSLSLDDPSSHLTNDCMQKKQTDYGKFELGNKVMYQDFEKYLSNQGYERQWRTKVIPRMAEISLHLVKACCRKVDPRRRILSFELVGLDFLVDSGFEAILIEANNSPSLVKSENSQLNLLLEDLIEEVFQIAVDPLFPPPPEYLVSQKSSNPLNTNRFRLIFDEEKDGLPDLGDPNTYGYTPATRQAQPKMAEFPNFVSKSLKLPSSSQTN